MRNLPSQIIFPRRRRHRKPITTSLNSRSIGSIVLRILQRIRGIQINEILDAIPLHETVFLERTVEMHQLMHERSKLTPHKTIIVRDEATSPLGTDELRAIVSREPRWESPEARAQDHEIRAGLVHGCGRV